MNESNSGSAENAWKPLVSIDFFESSGKEFQIVVDKFREVTKEQPRDTFMRLHDGWHEITPQVAEELLKRNTRNRPVDWKYVLAYGTQMINHRWKKTGEPVIVNGNGDVDDAGHRLWACYLSRASFTTYVVNVESDPDLFAFIDSGKSRNASNTLYTAGFQNSSLLSKIVKDLAIPFDEQCLAYNGRLPRPPCTNIDILDYVRANPEMAETVRTIKEIYPVQVKRLGEVVACFVGWKIQTVLGSDELEDFFNNLARTDLPSNHPVAALQKRLDAHVAAGRAGRLSEAKKAHLTPIQILALSILAFNLSRRGVMTRRLDPRADDPFPDFDTSEVNERKAA
jgi:hypothetical protein